MRKAVMLALLFAIIVSALCSGEAVGKGTDGYYILKSISKFITSNPTGTEKALPSKEKKEDIIFYFQKAQSGDLRAAFNIDFKQDITFIYDARYEECFVASDLPLETESEFWIVRENEPNFEDKSVILFAVTPHLMKDMTLLPTNMQMLCKDKDIAWLRRAERSESEIRTRSKRHRDYWVGVGTGVAVGVAAGW